MSKNNTNTINANEEVSNVTLGEDKLLEQIDAFRDKAQQLQGLIVAKEQKVNELENLVNEKEVKINELQNTLSTKQAEADELVVDMSKQVDRMIESVNATLADIEKRLDDKVTSSEENTEAKNREISETLGSVNDDLESIKADLSEKVHSENVKVYRNIHDLIQENDKSEENKKTILDKIKGTKAVAAWGLVFGIIDFVGIGAVVALMLKMAGLI